MWLINKSHKRSKGKRVIWASEKPRWAEQNDLAHGKKGSGILTTAPPSKIPDLNRNINEQHVLQPSLRCLMSYCLPGVRTAGLLPRGIKREVCSL